MKLVLRLKWQPRQLYCELQVETENGDVIFLKMPRPALAGAIMDILDDAEKREPEK